MCYKCDKCQSVRNGKVLLNVAEVRLVNYIRGFNRINKRDKSSEFIVDSTYQGNEHVKVDKLCESCYNIYKDVPPKLSSHEKDVKFIAKRAKVPELKTTKNDEEYNTFRYKFEGVE